MRRKILLFILACLIGVNILYYYGRSIWHPYYVRISGGKTAQEAVALYEPAVLKRMDTVLEARGLSGYPSRLMLIALKDSGQLELWGEYDRGYQFIKVYEFTGFSGELGPKLEEGDGQIPEGLYGIEYLNPNSSFHLSMKVSYPNQFDQKMAQIDGRSNLGGDIMIHGKNATIGCIPVGDEGIEELFVWVYKVGSFKTSVLICPTDFRVKSGFPEVEGIDWENALYDNLTKELLKFRREP